MRSFSLSSAEKAHGLELLAANPGRKVMMWKRQPNTSVGRFIASFLVSLVVSFVASFAASFFIGGALRRMERNQHIVPLEACLGNLNADGSYINK